MALILTLIVLDKMAVMTVPEVRRLLEVALPLANRGSERCWLGRRGGGESAIGPDSVIIGIAGGRGMLVLVR